MHRKTFKNKKLSRKANRYISEHIKRSDFKLVNLEIDKAVAEKLNKLVKNSNIVRDALINRIIFFTIAGPSVYKKLGVSTALDTVIRESDYGLSLSLSPLNAISEFLEDPLMYVKEAFQLAHQESIYLYDFSDLKIKGVNTHCFSCFIEDRIVPGTQEFEDFNSKLDALIEELLREGEEAKNAH